MVVSTKSIPHSIVVAHFLERSNGLKNGAELPSSFFGVSAERTGRMKDHKVKVIDDIQFKGRCYQGDGVGLIDVSAFIVGTLSVKARYFNDGTGWAEDHFFSTEVDGVAKTLRIQDTHRAAHIEIYDDAVLVAEYSGCEQLENGPLLSDILVSNGNNATLTGADLTTFFLEDSSVPYSWLNDRGYSIGGGGEVVQPTRSSDTIGTDGTDLEFKGRLAPRLTLEQGSVNKDNKLSSNSVVTFPDIPSMPHQLRGQSFTVDDIELKSRLLDNISSKNGASSIVVTSDVLDNRMRQRSGLIERVESPLDIGDVFMFWDFRISDSYTLVDDKVQNINDLSGVSPLFTQASPTERCVIEDNCLKFTGSEYYSSAGASLSHFKRLHDGSPYSIHIAMDSDVLDSGDTDFLFGNNAGSWSNVGFYLLIEQNQGIRHAITKGVQYENVTNFGSGGILNKDAVEGFTLVFNPNGVGNVCTRVYRSGALVATANLLSDDFSQNDPLRQMTFGLLLGNNPFSLKCKFRGACFFGKALSVSEIERTDNYYK